MGIRIIYGAIGSGKSRRCLDEIAALHAENPSARCIMLVPDHYSYEAEKNAVRRFGGTGLNNIEVLTLRRMAINILTVSELNHITEAGRQMLIYKAVTNASEELSQREGADMKLISSMRRTGFLDSAASLISEMKRYLISPEALSEKTSEVTDNKTLKNKLTAFSAVYEKYTGYVANSGFTDSEDDLRALASHIEKDGIYDQNTYVWVDRFDILMPQQLCVMEAMLRRGVNMTFTVCFPADGGDEEKELYAETGKTYSKIMSLAAAYGFQGEINAGVGLAYLRPKRDLYTLLSRFGGDFTYDGAPENIRLFQSRGAYSETERIACQICDLVREEGCRYRDIAVLCGDEDEYIHLIEAVFGEYGIPYFTDRKIILSDHPIAMQILSLFRILEEDWSYDSVFRYLRAGFLYRRTEKGVFPVNQNQIDSLENFVLKYGIRGAKRWLSEDSWTYGGDLIGAAFGDVAEQETADFINSIRLEISKPIEAFAEKSKGKKTARERASALFEYLEDINLYAGLKYEIYKFKQDGMLNEAEQFTKIWNLILDVLNQSAAALSDDKMTLSEFADYISVGLSKCEIRTIPSGIDQVYVGSAERVSRGKVKYMFAAGAKEGTFPSVIKTEGFFSNHDRSVMSGSLGIQIAPDTKTKTDEQYFKVYRALCTVTDKLFLSYSVQDSEGHAQTASHLITDIARKFPQIHVTNDLMQDLSRDIVYISSPKATMHRLLVKLSDRYGGRKNPLWEIVREWFEESGGYKQALSLMDRADYYSRRGVLLDGDIAALLYDGTIKYSASRLNTFASCPFEYFLKYGLGAKKRDEWEINAANMGSYAHRVINEFCAEVEKSAVSNSEKIAAWKKLTSDEREKIIGTIIDATCENMLSSAMRGKERTAAIFRRMGKTISEAAALVQKSLSAGSYAENGMELKFEANLGKGVSLSGTIDRLDECDAEDGGKYIRIVDYKTGRTEFDIVNMFNGCDMQMALYALAVRDNMTAEGQRAEVTGVYYTGVKSEYAKLSSPAEEDGYRASEQRKLRLDGVTFADEDENRRRSMLHSMEDGIYTRGDSEFTDVKIEDGVTHNVRSLDEINGLMEYVREMAVKTDSRARSGDISLSPYDANGRGGACAYCDYASVCRFDEKNKVMRKKSGNADEIWEIMKTKGAASREVTDDAKVDQGAGKSDI